MVGWGGEGWQYLIFVWFVIGYWSCADDWRVKGRNIRLNMVNCVYIGDQMCVCIMFVFWCFYDTHTHTSYIYIYISL